MAFGYKAEDQYYDLVQEDNHHDCYFFKEFTKHIHKLQVRLSFTKMNQTIIVVINRLYRSKSGFLLMKVNVLFMSI